MSHITGAHDEVHQNERGETYSERIEVIEVDEDARDTSHSSLIRQSVVSEVRSNDQRIESAENELTVLRETVRENARLHDRVSELEETVEKIRADLAAFWSLQEQIEDGRYAVPLDGERYVWLSESVDQHDPMDEFL
jgi:hypothetical protein